MVRNLFFFWCCFTPNKVYELLLLFSFVFCFFFTVHFVRLFTLYTTTLHLRVFVGLDAWFTVSPLKVAPRNLFNHYKILSVRNGNFVLNPWRRKYLVVLEQNRWQLTVILLLLNYFVAVKKGTIAELNTVTTPIYQHFFMQYFYCETKTTSQPRQPGWYKEGGNIDAGISSRAVFLMIRFCFCTASR